MTPELDRALRRMTVLQSRAAIARRRRAVGVRRELVLRGRRGAGATR